MSTEQHTSPHIVEVATETQKPVSMAETRTSLTLARDRWAGWAAIASTALGLLLSWRLALWLFALLAMSTYLPTPPPTTLVPFFGRTFLSGEAHWQMQLAKQGYAAAGETPALAAFPPLYAALVRLAALIIPSWTIAAAFVAHAALLGALVYILALAGFGRERPLALRAAVATLLWPGAMTLGTIAPDALLLLTVAGALYHARREQWVWAAGWAALAGLTRGAGLLVCLPLLVLWLQGHPWRAAIPARQRLGGALAVAAAPLAFAGFLGLLWWQLGDPLAFFRAQGLIGSGSLRRPLGLATLADWRAILDGTAPLIRGYPPTRTVFRTNLIPAIIDAGTFLVAGAAGLWLLWRRQLAEGVFTVAGVAGALAVWGLPGSAHHLLPLVPLYVVLARWTARPLVGYLAALLGLQLFTLAYYLYLNLL